MFPKETFDWVTFKSRPKKDGFHDSGYRFIEVYGVQVKRENANTLKQEKKLLSEWADNITISSTFRSTITGLQESASWGIDI